MRNRWWHEAPDFYGGGPFPMYGPTPPDIDPLAVFDRNIRYWKNAEEEWKKSNKPKDDGSKDFFGKVGLSAREIFWIMMLFSPVLGPCMAWFYIQSWQHVAKAAGIAN